MTEVTGLLQDALTDEQLRIWVQAVEDKIRDRDRSGSLLSKFDCFAMGMTLFFMVGKQDRIPASWVFSTVREDDLPDGLLDQILELRQVVKEATGLEEDIDDIREVIANLRRKAIALGKASDILDDKLQEIGLKAKAPQPKTPKRVF